MPPVVTFVYIYTWVREWLIQSPPPTCAASVYFHTDDNEYATRSFTCVGVTPGGSISPPSDSKLYHF